MFQGGRAKNKLLINGVADQVSVSVVHKFCDGLYPENALNMSTWVMKPRTGLEHITMLFMFFK